MHKNEYQEARECKSFPLWFKSAMDCNFTHIFFSFSLKKKKKIQWETNFPSWIYAFECHQLLSTIADLDIKAGLNILYSLRKFSYFGEFKNNALLKSP